MTILDKIIAQKRIEIINRKAEKSIFNLEKELYFSRKCLSLKENLSNSPTGIISEFKRKSPSKGWIYENADVSAVVKGYCEAGAAGISILTDEPFFGGTPDDLLTARSLVKCPILRKDFVVDEYQLFEAKALGADLILLIAASLTIEQCKTLAHRAKSLGLEVLLEVHNREELAHTNEFIDILGVNNRNLKTFEVNTDISKELAELIPSEFAKISESGISSPDTVKELRKYGYQGFLMGENFMKEKDPTEAFSRFISLID